MSDHEQIDVEIDYNHLRAIKETNPDLVQCGSILASSTERLYANGWVDNEWGVTEDAHAAMKDYEASK